MVFARRVFLATFLSISLLDSAGATVEAVIGPIPLGQNPNVDYILPKSDNSEILISRSQYLISYNKNQRAANWVAWSLVANQIGDVPRSNKFQQDAELETYLTANGGDFHAVKQTEFQGSCFDRGHQAPSEDRTDTADDNLATFEMSNMIPQTPYLNRTIWEHFESYTRSFVQDQGKHVFIIAGPIYDEDFGSIGPNSDIPVPSKNFKIVFILDGNTSPALINKNTPYVAVIMPNVLKSGDAPVPNATGCASDDPSGEVTSFDVDDWKPFQATLEDIEQAATLSFDLN